MRKFLIVGALGASIGCTSVGQRPEYAHGTMVPFMTGPDGSLVPVAQAPMAQTPTAPMATGMNHQVGYRPAPTPGYTYPPYSQYGMQVPMQPQFAPGQGAAIQPQQVAMMPVAGLQQPVFQRPMVPPTVSPQPMASPYVPQQPAIHQPGSVGAVSQPQAPAGQWQLVTVQLPGQAPMQAYVMHAPSAGETVGTLPAPAPRSPEAVVPRAPEQMMPTQAPALPLPLEGPSAAKPPATTVSPTSAMAEVSTPEPKPAVAEVPQQNVKPEKETNVSTNVVQVSATARSNEPKKETTAATFAATAPESQVVAKPAADKDLEVAEQAIALQVLEAEIMALEAVQRQSNVTHQEEVRREGEERTRNVNNTVKALQDELSTLKSRLESAQSTEPLP